MIADGCIMLPVYTHFCSECGSGVHLDYIPYEWDDEDPECIDLWGMFVWKCSRRMCSAGQAWKEIKGYITENGITCVH